VRELTSTVLSRPPKACNFIEWKDQKVVYKRYASLFFVAGIDASDNELIVLEQIHLFVEVLDRYFGNVRKEREREREREMPFGFPCLLSCYCRADNGRLCLLDRSASWTSSSTSTRRTTSWTSC
jgi:hypothetical protein